MPFLALLPIGSDCRDQYDVFDKPGGENKGGLKQSHIELLGQLSVCKPSVCKNGTWRFIYISLPFII